MELRRPSRSRAWCERENTSLGLQQMRRECGESQKSRQIGPIRGSRPQHSSMCSLPLSMHRKGEPLTEDGVVSRWQTDLCWKVVSVSLSVQCGWSAQFTHYPKTSKTRPFHATHLHKTEFSFWLCVCVVDLLEVVCLRKVADGMCLMSAYSTQWVRYGRGTGEAASW